jgi:ABC-type amino acid transport substrate-binding protein
MKKTMAVLMSTALLVAVLVGCASQVETDLSAADQAKDTAGAADLSTAAVPVSAYQAENGGLDGFNAAAAKAIEPALQWADGGPATLGVVSIRGAAGDSVVLVTLSGSGSPVCLAFSGGVQSQGTTDAQTAADCH